MMSFDFGHELRHEQAQCMLWAMATVVEHNVCRHSDATC